MRNSRPLFVAIPAFFLGCLVTAGLVSTAQAQAKLVGKSLPMYRTVTSERDLNRYAAEGYAVKDSNATANYVEYLMQRYR